MKNTENKNPSLGKHAYNTESKRSIGTLGASRSNYAKGNNTLPPAKQSLPTQKLDLQYDIIEDLKKTCANINMYDLL